MKTKTVRGYDKENDIMFVSWEKGYDHSVELNDGSLILDYDKKGNIIGFEIFGYLKQIRKGMKKYDKIFRKKTPNRHTE